MEPNGAGGPKEVDTSTIEEVKSSSAEDYVQDTASY
jgi:hypothetical protein